MPTISEHCDLCRSLTEELWNIGVPACRDCVIHATGIDPDNPNQ